MSDQTPEEKNEQTTRADNASSGVTTPIAATAEAIPQTTTEATEEATPEATEEVTPEEKVDEEETLATKKDEDDEAV